MTDGHDAMPIEDLLAHAGWVQALARSLVRTNDEADDVVQQTWLAAVTCGPREPHAAGSWLARVVRNFAFRRRREEDRRQRREAAVARPDVATAPPDALLGRLELQRQIAEEVAHLAEPYRTTILLRYFESLGVAQIAEAQRISADTVKTRLRRALEQLRERFDRRYGGDRSAWCALLIPLAGASLAVTGGATAAAAELGAVTGIHTATGGGALASTAATGGLGAVTIGGIIMAQKIVLATVAVLALGVGIGVGRYTAPVDKDSAMQRHALVPRTDLDGIKAKYDATAKELARVAAEKDALYVAREELAAALSLREKEEAAPAAEPSAAAAKDSKLPIAFGEAANLEQLQNADWHDLAKAMDTLTKLIGEIVADGKKGQQPSPDLQNKIMKENQRLLGLATSIMGKLPTHRTGNGEFTHPIVMSNLMAALLDNAELPLGDEQKADFASYGAEYCDEYAKLQNAYTEDTPDFEKVLDELALKRACMDKCFAALTPEQRERIVNPETQGRMQLDLFSPMLMAMMSAQASNWGTAETIKTSVPKDYALRYSLDAQTAAQAQEAFDAWYQDIEPSLTPVDQGDPLHIDATLAAGRAQAKLAKALLALPGLSDASRAAIRQDMGWIVPQVMATAAKAAPAEAAPAEQGK